MCALVGCKACLNSSNHTIVISERFSHYANSVRNLLNTHPGGWISRRGTSKGAPKPLNLTPMDFFSWGAVKDPVYNSKLRSLDNLKMEITTQFNAIYSIKELCARVYEFVISLRRNALNGMVGNLNIYYNHLFLLLCFLQICKMFKMLML